METAPRLLTTRYTPGGPAPFVCAISFSPQDPLMRQTPRQLRVTNAETKRCGQPTLPADRRRKRALNQRSLCSPERGQGAPKGRSLASTWPPPTQAPRPAWPASPADPQLAPPLFPYDSVFTHTLTLPPTAGPRPTSPCQRCSLATNLLRHHHGHFSPTPS